MTSQSLQVPITYPVIQKKPFLPKTLPVVVSKPSKSPRMAYTGFSRGNCVTTVRRAGYAVPRSVDGYARTIPVSSTSLPPEGQLVIIKTAESWMGHVLVGKVVNGQIVSVIDSVGSGRVIPMEVYRGYI